MTELTQEMKFIHIQNAVYLLAQTGVDCSAGAVRVIREADKNPEKLDELHKLCEELLRLQNSKFQTYPEILENACNWCATRNAIVSMLCNPCNLVAS